MWDRRKISCEGRLGLQDVFSSCHVKGNTWFLQYLYIELEWQCCGVHVGVCYARSVIPWYYNYHL